MLRAMDDPETDDRSARFRNSRPSPGWGGARAGAGAPPGPRASRIARDARIAGLARAVVRPDARVRLGQPDIFHLAALSLMADRQFELAGDLFCRAERLWQRRDRNSRAARAARVAVRAARVATEPPLS